MWKFVLILTILGLLRETESLDEIRYPDDASVYIGGFFSVYLPGSSGCSSTADPYSIQEFEAVRWIIDKLNNNAFLNGSDKIGIHAYKTCGIPEMATSSAIDLSQTYPNTSQSAFLFALLSPTKSSEAKHVSRLFSLLPEKDRLLMLSFGATSTKLADQSLYKNFFRITPPDSVQVQVMLELMLELKWNYVGIIYEDDDYGKDAAQLLKTLASDKGICVPVYSSFNNTNSDEMFELFVLNVLNHKLGGIIYIGSGNLITKLLELLQSSSLVLDIEIIVSESNRLNSLYFRRYGQAYFPISRGILVTSAPKIELQEFTEYWKNIKNKTFSQSWISETGDSGVLDSEQSVYVNYAVKAVLVLANLLKKLSQKHCDGSNTICPQLRHLSKQTYIDEMANLKINLTAEFPYTSQMFQNTLAENITFKANREINYNSEPNQQEYEVFNFQQCTKLTNCRFVKVGDYRLGVMSLHKSLISSYPKEESQGPNTRLPSVQCPNGTDCIKCIPSDISDHVIFVDGEWYVVAVVPVFVPDETDTLLCTNTIRDSLGTDIAESIKFAIEEINHPNSTLISSKKKVGLIVINGCASELVIKDKLLRLHKGTYELRPGMNSSEINHRILGYVGGMSSSMSAAMAEVLAKLGYVQVSYASTSPLLSDRTLYPYFLRIPTADDQQVKVVIDMVTSLDSNIIQVIYTEGSYGEGAYSTLEKLGKDAGVCVIGHKVPVATDYTLYNGLLAKLRETPQAKLVVTFVRSHVIEHVVKAVTERMAESEFIFIGSETWGGRESVIPEQQRKVYGSLSIALELPPIPAFIPYLTKQNINDQSDQWLRRFLEKRGKCIFTGSFQRAGKNEVNGKTKECDLESLVMSLYNQWIPFAVASTKALVKGLENVLSSTTCGQPATSCPEQNPTLLAEYTKTNVKLDLYGKGSQERVFDDNGDGVVKYLIMHITAGEKRYTQVGSWSKSEGIIFYKDSLYYSVKDYNSVCLTDYTCNKCFSDKMEETSPEQSTDWKIPTLAVLVCLLGISVVIIAIQCHRSCRDRKLQEPHYAEPENMTVQNHRNDPGRNVPNQISSDIYLTASSNGDTGSHTSSADESAKPPQYADKHQYSSVSS
ncbi:uncharacterized protein LOC126829756 [Patella vulgata]|uniref:uncharacterized protein LOC126829756 n=1 Tax=Patella vulgata TaxID=6465 RepID=UPI0024A94F02|nr:uncharacterized protein LOC126829756 [Patella vulgata]